MKIIFGGLGIIILFFGYYYVQIQRKIKVSQAIVNDTVPYELGGVDYSKSLLVLGDSTAVGVGALNPEDSLPGLYAQEIQATYVENLAVSGAKIQEVQSQVQESSQQEYTDILLQIGANNVVALQSVAESEKDLRVLLGSLPKHQHLTVLMCGDVGAATILPWFVRPYYTKKNIAYHEMFERVVPEFGGVYVNLYTEKVIQPFLKEPEIYLAKDEFHPSSAGYLLWFERVQEVLKQK